MKLELAIALCTLLHTSLTVSDACKEQPSTCLIFVYLLQEYKQKLQYPFKCVLLLTIYITFVLSIIILC